MIKGAIFPGGQSKEIKSGALEFEFYNLKNETQSYHVTNMKPLLM